MIYTRWMIAIDIQDVLEIERLCYGDRGWSREDFMFNLRRSNCIGMVALDECEIVRGFMLYELLKSELHLLNFAVDPEYQRRGVGTAMARRLGEKLTAQRRTRIHVEVREYNVTAQLFFRAMGFRATETLRHWYEESDEDAYRMVYELGSVPVVVGANRIAGMV